MFYKNQGKRVIDHNLKGKAFTLVELLVVIVIISILSAIIAASLGSARKQARDTARITAALHVAQAIEEYYTDKNKQYPTSTNSPNGVCIETDTTIQNAIKPYLGGSFPKDPLYTPGDTTHCFVYKTSSDGQSFKVFTRLEDQNNFAAQVDGGTQNTPDNNLMYETYSPEETGKNITYSPPQAECTATPVLTNILAKQGAQTILLSPSFNSNVFNYTGQTSVTSITVTVSFDSSIHTAYINSTQAQNGVAATVSVSTGPNNISIEVRSIDGSCSSVFYTLVITVN